MKKFLALLLASVMTLALLAGCGGGNGDQTPSTPDTPSNTDTPDTPYTPDTPDTPDTPSTSDGEVPTITWYMVVGAIVLGFFVCFAAMYGFDKLKQTMEQINSIKRKKE